MSVVEWVSDQLHDLLGLSDRLTSEFLVGLARKSRSAEIFIQQIEDTGTISMNNEVRTFASELWNKVPHKAVTEKPARAAEREAILQQKNNKSYQLLSDPEEEQDSGWTSRRRSTSKQSEYGAGVS